MTITVLNPFSLFILRFGSDKLESGALMGSFILIPKTLCKVFVKPL